MIKQRRERTQQSDTTSKPSAFNKPLVLLWCFIGSVSLLASCSCSEAFQQAKWSDGTYEVWDINYDGRELYRITSYGGLHGRVGEEVMAVGSDNKFVVAKQRDKDNNDREQYFYLVKAEDAHALNQELVQGPYSKSRFDQLSDQLGLPEFSKEF